MSRDPSLAFRIREAAPNHSAALALLVRALNQHQGDPSDHFDEATLERDVFGADPCLGALVAEDATGLIGYAFFRDGYESAYAARGVYLCDLYVGQRSAAKRRWTCPCCRRGEARKGARPQLSVVGFARLERGGAEVLCLARRCQ